MNKSYKNYMKDYRQNVVNKNKLNPLCAHCKCNITHLPKTRKFCDKCLKHGRGRKMLGEYRCRIIVKSTTHKHTYGFTLPTTLVKKYHLLNKKFKIDITKEGKIILYSQLNQKTK